LAALHHASTANGDDLEILARHGQRLAAALVEALQDFGQVARQAGLPRLVQQGGVYAVQADLTCGDLR
jgi:hypothetical protein